MKALVTVLKNGRRTGAECVFVISNQEKTYEGLIMRIRKLVMLPQGCQYFTVSDEDGGYPVNNTSSWAAACGRAVHSAAQKDQKTAFQNAVVCLNIETAPQSSPMPTNPPPPVYVPSAAPVAAPVVAPVAPAATSEIAPVVAPAIPPKESAAPASQDGLYPVLDASVPQQTPGEVSPVPQQANVTPDGGQDTQSPPPRPTSKKPPLTSAPGVGTGIPQGDNGDIDLVSISAAALVNRSKNRVVQNSITEITAEPGSTAKKVVKTAAGAIVPGAVKLAIAGVGAAAAAVSFLVHGSKRPFGVVPIRLYHLCFQMS